MTGYRVHPGYRIADPESPDDVAVLTLETPLALGKATAQAIALPRPGTMLPAGRAVSLAGFGQQSSERLPDGTLSRMNARLVDQTTCAGLDNPNHAVLLCAVSARSASCTGDSGSALIYGNRTPRIIGIDSAGRSTCTPGDVTIFTNVAAPEVLLFIKGDMRPPRAPRQTGPVTLVPRGAHRVGQALRCSSGAWTGKPAFSFEFLDAKTGRTLRAGAGSSYVLTPREVGLHISCRVRATNPGGTGVAETSAPTSAVKAQETGSADLRRGSGSTGSISAREA